MDDILRQIRDFADYAYEGRQCKFTNEEYIRHPERVMYMCLDASEDRAILAAALLHDVLEETSISEEQLYGFLRKLMDKEEANKTMGLILDLTNFHAREHPETSWEDRKQVEGERLALISPEAQTIKYADIIDNVIDIVPNSSEYADKYLEEAEYYLEKMNNGNNDLRRRAATIVQRSLARVQGHVGLSH